MKLFYSFLLFFIACFCSCRQNAADNKNSISTDSLTKMKMATDSNMITAAIDSTSIDAGSLDWEGTYKGNFPTEHAPKGSLTAFEIMLHRDNTFMASAKDGDPRYETDKAFAAEHGGDRKIARWDGKFKWIDSSTIQLNAGYDHSKYLVEKNKLIMLDSAGKKFNGADAAKYILTKEK